MSSPQDMPIIQSASNLSRIAHELFQSSLPTNTKRAYQGALDRLYAWLDGRKLTDTLLANYVAKLHSEGKSVATINQVLATVRFLAKTMGQPSPDGVNTRQVIKTIRRKRIESGRGQVTGIQWSQADAVAAVSVSKKGGRKVSIQDLRDAAIIAVTSDAMLRVSEVSALKVSDFEAEAPNTITVRQSKSDQQAKGTVLYIGKPTVKRVCAWLDAAGIDRGDYGDIFRRISRGGRALGPREEGKPSLSPDAVRIIIKKRALDAGIEGHISGHSLRVGAAQSLGSKGASVVDMQTAGRWKSPDMPAHYARGEMAERSAVARLRYGTK